jgi:hypothetical protein
MEMHDGIKTNKIFIENNMCQYWIHFSIL